MISGIEVAYVHGRGERDRLVTWYSNTLELGPPEESGHWHEYRLDDGSRFALDIPGPIRTEVEKQRVVISFRVEDIRSAVRTLIERGVVFASKEDPIFDVGPAWVAAFRDPEGTWLQISQSKPTAMACEGQDPD